MLSRRLQVPKLCRPGLVIVNISLLMSIGSAAVAAPPVPTIAHPVDPVGTGRAPVETFDALASRCAGSVHPRTLSAIVLQESQGNPFAIGINGRKQLPRQPRTEQEAIATAQWLLAKGYNFDAGLGQINSGNFAALGLTPANLFNPCTNLRSAATVLTSCYSKSSKSYGRGQAGLHGALSCYNTGSLTRGFNNGYVRNVVSKVALQVPALAPSSSRQIVSPPVTRDGGSTSEAPIADAQTPSEIADAQPLDAGMGDAFSTRKGDAFTPPVRREEASVVTGADQTPFMLTATRPES